MCFKYIRYFNGKNNFVFIGDMRIRQVYQSFIHELDKEFRVASLKSDLVENCIQQYIQNGSNATLNGQMSNMNLNYSNKALNLEIVSIFFKYFILN